MRLVEAVGVEVFKLFPKLLGSCLLHSFFYTAFNESHSQRLFDLCALACALLGQDLAKKVAFIKTDVLSKAMSHRSNLLLEDKISISLFCDVLVLLVDILDILRIILRLNIINVDICRERTRTIDGGNSRQVNQVLWFGFNTEALSTSLCKLEHSCPLSFVENVFIYLLVV